ncbi:MAG: hypothetical protein A3J79_00330 [Elusimicrobia bacterium RIFOXYB2_FULL_62_6]|nr:MAG: hypothetical protein A3J79_00330 [Elusimicrobia bacterium RIFOXYB2_FULL_62_6]
MKIKGLTTKHIMRKALGAYLPEEILKMPKKGFVMPTPFWLKDSLRDFAGDAISAARTHSPGLFDYDFAEKLLEEHRSGRRDNARKLTCLVSLFIWQRSYR